MPVIRLMGIAAVSILILALRTAWLWFSDLNAAVEGALLWPLLQQWLFLSGIPLACVYAYQPSYPRCGLWPLMLAVGFIALNSSILVRQAQPYASLWLALISWTLAFALRAFHSSNDSNQRTIFMASAAGVLISLVGVLFFSNSATIHQDQSVNWLGSINAQQPFLTLVVLGMLAALRQGKAAITGWLMLLPSTVALVAMPLVNPTKASSVNSALLMLALAFFLLWQLSKVAPMLNNFSKPNARSVAVAATLLLFCLQLGQL